MAVAIWFRPTNEYLLLWWTLSLYKAACEEFGALVNGVDGFCDFFLQILCIVTISL